MGGVLVVDRYNGYNKAPVAIQYCQAHLLREVKDLSKEFSDNQEVQVFVEETSDLLSQAMKLRALAITDAEYLIKAKELQNKIEGAMNASAQHLGIQRIQNIYRKHKDRMYHWARDRGVPADNNFAERELRPLVIARKVSFGSQSEEGAITRETLMSILRTMKLRGQKVKVCLKRALDELSANPQTNPFSLLFPSSPTEN